MLKDSNYRPNPSRSIALFGDITDALVSNLCCQVLGLRAESSDPITVYVNSNGGSIRGLEVLNSALRGPDIDGQSCRIITVATGNAASAAATLLAYGDYAIAHADSLIYFHGARLERSEVTREKASTLAAQLDRRNQDIALKVAQQVIHRLVHRYTILKHEISASSENEKFWLFIDELGKRCGTEISALIGRVKTQVYKCGGLSEKILLLPEIKDSDGTYKADLAVLHVVIEFEKEQSNNQLWRLDEKGLNQATSDYFLIRDFIFGEHTKLRDGLMNAYGLDFLGAEELRKYSELYAVDREQAMVFFGQVGLPILNHFWFFTVCLCRQLQEGENQLTPAESYWLGIVDEILGTDLGGRRVIAEAEPMTPAADPFEKINKSKEAKKDRNRRSKKKG